MTRQDWKKWMVSIALVLTFFTANYAQAQDNVLRKDDLFAGADEFAKGATHSTEVNLDKNMLGLVGRSANETDLAKHLDFVYVRSFQYEKPGQYKMADIQKFMKRLDSGGWIHVVRVRSATENTDICMRNDDDGQLSEMAILAAAPTELTFVHLKGHMSMDELSRMGRSYGAPALKTRPK